MKSWTIVDTFKKPVSHDEGKVIQMLAQNTVTILILNFQCKRKKCSAGFSLHLQRLLFKEEKKIAIKNWLTNMGEWPYEILITRSIEPCGFGLIKWSLHDWKIQGLLSALLKCICVSQELQQENCSWLYKCFPWTFEIRCGSFMYTITTRIITADGMWTLNL